MIMMRARMKHCRQKNTVIIMFSCQLTNMKGYAKILAVNDWFELRGVQCPTSLLIIVNCKLTDWQGGREKLS